MIYPLHHIKYMTVVTLIASILFFTPKISLAEEGRVAKAVNLEECIKAAIENNVEAIEELLRDGSDVNLSDESGHTIMMSAAGYGNTETVQLLLDAGADVHLFDKGGKTALIHAAGPLGNIETVQLLLDAGADVNTKDSLGQTALILATKFGHPEIVQILMEAGARE